MVLGGVRGMHLYRGDQERVGAGDQRLITDYEQEISLIPTSVSLFQRQENVVFTWPNGRATGPRIENRIETHAMSEHRMRGLNRDQVQFAGIHARLDGSVNFLFGGGFSSFFS